MEIGAPQISVVSYQISFPVIYSGGKVEDKEEEGKEEKKGKEGKEENEENERIE